MQAYLRLEFRCLCGNTKFDLPESDEDVAVHCVTCGKMVGHLWTIEAALRGEATGTLGGAPDFVVAPVKNR